ncbi:MAG: hypothetical protein JW783_09480 [Bacteroidales bacterium]|nr:hypothetical protein [Bacteroidales bacterium]MBN2748058.1 hypothetical protein [Bacteroidales bacterium]
MGIKRIVILIILAITILATGLISLFFWLNTKKDARTNPLYAIPIDAAIIAKIEKYHSFSSALKENNKVWETLISVSAANSANQFLVSIDTLAKRSSGFNQLLQNNPIYLSVHQEGKESLGTLAAAALPVEFSKSDLAELIKSLTVGSYLIDDIGYSGAAFYHVSKGDSASNHEFYIAYQKGIVLCSNSKLIAQASIRQLNEGASLQSNPSFMAIAKTMGSRVDGNIFINTKKFPKTFGFLASGNYKKAFAEQSDLANWIELDLFLKSDAVLLNGFAQAPDSLNAFLRVFSRQRTVSTNFHSVVPTQVGAFAFMGISNLDYYLSDYRAYLDRQGKLSSYSAAISKLNRELGTDAQELVSSFFGKELALVYVPFEGLSYADCWFVVAQARSKSLAQQTLSGAANAYAQKQGINGSSYRNTFRVDREKNIDIYKFPVDGLFNTLFGSLFSQVSATSYTFIDDFVVFGSSFEAISRFVLSNVHNKQLASDNLYKEFSELLSAESNFFLYLNPIRAQAVFNEFLSPKYAKELADNSQALANLQGIAFQLNGGSDMVFTNIATRFSSEQVDHPQTVWETRLDTSFAMKPQLVVNHNTNNREIFVQDLHNNIYLINDVGRVLWKRKLPESIMGEVNQLDLYKNGKLQLVFNTASYLWAVDRNGNDVEGFPVKLRSEAANAIAVFDYEGTRDYRIFVASADRRVYAYDGKGRLVTGWKFDKSERIVTEQIQHFRDKGKDYIVFADDNRPYILDRQGDERVKPSRFFSKAKSSSFVLENGSERTPARLVTTDTLGVVKFIYFDGQVDDLPLKAFSAKHFFDYQDVNADGRKDFIFLDNKKLCVFGSNQKPLFDIGFDSEPLPKVIYFNFGGRDRKLGITCNRESKIYLVNGSGSIYEGFPLRGDTPFSIGQFANTRSKFNLVAGSPSGLLLNYAVQ